MCNGNPRKRRKEETETTYEVIMTRTFSRLMSHTKPQIQETQRTLSRVSAKTNNKKHYSQATPILLLKSRKSTIKKKNLERSQRGEKHLTYTEAKIRIMSKFPSETIQARREYSKIF